MINKSNWKLIKQYLDMLQNNGKIVRGTWKVEQTCLRYLIEWAGEVSFLRAPSIVPTFPVHLRSARLDGKDIPISPAHTKKILASARRFFMWLIENNRDYRIIKISWVKNLEANRLSNTPKVTDAVTREDITRIANAPAETVMERRIRASAVFWYLSGIRIGAYVSLPIKAVDLENRVVYQYSTLGVQTKGGKSAKTYLLNIPELVAVCKEWEQELKQVLQEDGFWFAPLYSDSGEINPDCKEKNETRVMIARKNLKEWLQKVGLPYHSPHKFRHGHVHYGQAHSTTKEDYKAISQNVMHSTTAITDQYYSNLDDNLQKNRIDSMVTKDQNKNNPDQELEEYRQFLEWKRLKNKMTC